MEQLLADIESVGVQAKAPPRQNAYVRLATCVSGNHRAAAVRTLQQRGIDARAFYTRTLPLYQWSPHK